MVVVTVVAGIVGWAVKMAAAVERLVPPCLEQAEGKVLVAMESLPVQAAVGTLAYRRQAQGYDSGKDSLGYKPVALEWAVEPEVSVAELVGAVQDMVAGRAVEPAVGTVADQAESSLVD